MLKSLILCAIHTNDEKEIYTWALVKADLRIDSRLKTETPVKNRTERAALTIKDYPRLWIDCIPQRKNPFL